MANTTKSATARTTKTTSAKKPPGATPARKPRATTGATEVSDDVRSQMIAEAAYLRAEQRGFNGGDPIEDWLAAEREVDRLLAERAPRLTQ